MDKISKVQLIQTTETAIDTLIDAQHKAGLSYWEILKILLGLCRRIEPKVEAENCLKEKEHEQNRN